MAIAGFAVIIWVEHVFHALDNPISSGILLTGLIAAAVVASVLFQREVWCRHLCPLGRLASALAPAAPLQISANKSVCASACAAPACYKGTPESPGCTVFHHPLAAKQSYRCKLCLDCLISCPNGSARLQLRSPLAAIWQLDARATDIAMFAIATSLLALSLLAVRSFPALAGAATFTALCVAAVAAGIGLHYLIIKLAGTEQRIGTYVKIAVTVMILGWSALMIGQLANIPLLAGTRVVLPSSPWFPGWMPLEISALLALQVGFVVTGVLVAAISLHQIRARERLSRAYLALSLPVIYGGSALYLLFR
jgi:polyferredoxin